MASIKMCQLHSNKSQHTKMIIVQLLQNLLCYAIDNRYTQELETEYVVDGSYPCFTRLFMHPYTLKNLISTQEYPALSTLLYFNALKFLGLSPPGIKMYILQSMCITFYSSSSKQLSWLQTHHCLVQAIKIPKKYCFYTFFFCNTTTQPKPTKNLFMQ